MTNPVILYGIDSNGDAYPVQVDSTGRLVAEGLQGIPGETGPQGPPGVDGEYFALPPDPYEGALLGWIDNQLAWTGGDPIVIPPAFFGPITDVSTDGELVVSGSIPESVLTGTELIQVDDQSEPWSDIYDVSELWSSFGPYEEGCQKNINNAFDLPVPFYNWWQPCNLAEAVWTPPEPIPYETCSIYLRNDSSSYANNIVINGKNLGYYVSGQKDADQDWLAQWGVVSPLTSIKLGKNLSNGDGGYLRSVTIDGKRLLDSSLKPTWVVSSVSGDRIFGSSKYGSPFSVGGYLLSKETRIAPVRLHELNPSLFIDIARQGLERRNPRR